MFQEVLSIILQQLIVIMHGFSLLLYDVFCDVINISFIGTTGSVFFYKLNRYSK